MHKISPSSLLKTIIKKYEYMVSQYKEKLQSTDLSTKDVVAMYFTGHIVPVFKNK